MAQVQKHAVSRLSILFAVFVVFFGSTLFLFSLTDMRKTVARLVRKRGFGRARWQPDVRGAQRVSSKLPVPNIVHMVFGLDPTFGHIKFGMIHYLAILGAHINIQPDAIHWHYKYEPTNNTWWDCANPMLTMIPEEDVTEVHGKPLKMRVQHRADIIRMKIMLEKGGMYIDSDVVPLRPFEELRRYNLSMGLEGGDGLCNAVMIGRPNSTFIQRWWAEYAHFNPDQWAYHSVLLPRQLQRQHPDEVLVLSDRAFFYPLWTQLTAMYTRDDGYDYHDNFAVHLWTSADEGHRNRLAKLSVADVFAGKGSFHRVARLLLAKAHAQGALCPWVAADVAAQLPSWRPEEDDPKAVAKRVAGAAAAAKAPA